MSVEEALITEMVEEPKVDEPELTGPSALPSVVSESSPLVSLQLIDSSPTAQDEVKPILMQEKSPMVMPTAELYLVLNR